MNIKNNNMKEITITLNVNEEQELKLKRVIELIKFENLINDEFRKRTSLKSEYDTLKEKCIELECKRLRVDELDYTQHCSLQNSLQTRLYSPIWSVVYMKAYIDKVEKELKDKEEFCNIKSFGGNSNNTANKPIYFAGINPVELKVEEHSRIILKDYNGKITNDFNLGVKQISKDECFNKYKDILTKEQIKELYKN